MSGVRMKVYIDYKANHNLAQRQGKVYQIYIHLWGHSFTNSPKQADIIVVSNNYHEHDISWWKQMTHKKVMIWTEFKTQEEARESRQASEKERANQLKNVKANPMTFESNTTKSKKVFLIALGNEWNKYEDELEAQGYTSVVKPKDAEVLVVTPNVPQSFILYHFKDFKHKIVKWDDLIVDPKAKSRQFESREKIKVALSNNLSKEEKEEAEMLIQVHNDKYEEEQWFSHADIILYNGTINHALEKFKSKLKTFKYFNSLI